MWFLHTENMEIIFDWCKTWSKTLLKCSQLGSFPQFVIFSFLEVKPSHLMSSVNVRHEDEDGFN